MWHDAVAADDAGAVGDSNAGTPLTQRMSSAPLTPRTPRSPLAFLSDAAAETAGIATDGHTSAQLPTLVTATWSPQSFSATRSQSFFLKL